MQSIWTSPSEQYQIFDIEQDWTFRESHMKPEGWFEWQELDLKHYSEDKTMNRGNKLQQLFEHLSLAIGNLGRKLAVADDIEELLHKQGFQNIKHDKIKVPLGGWPKDARLGLVLKPFSKGLGWSREEIEIFLAEVRKDVDRPDIHSMSDLHVIYAQKAP
ncbi:hypothetical protein LTR99_010975 [Exophiala xenobiotica]|uniref:Uncharacterized protein n=1 Tax=Vermiconidia calcicola TaxID=1690605 RepID=A0AAV9QHD0_9PEZI|nr:hypothetical protein LTR99_010975 [Exophiala xenobiotica]KAK5345311.1 hypothetical protein LTR61_010945 [Exophiala xenobiotica]KAK5528335.1 hypothetical protein LTR23_011048 [Chaetothyriales sp. CCFEE 6169]KAK5541376.1 hypothetical protein LTR25_003153 [Vermiconidia calcicola]